MSWNLGSCLEKGAGEEEDMPFERSWHIQQGVRGAWAQ